MRFPTFRWPVLLLFASVGLTALGLFEANRAVRSQRRIAERALHDYAGFVAWSYEQHLRELFAQNTQTNLGAVNHGDGMHSYPKVPDANDLPHYLPFNAQCGCHRSRYGPDPVMFFGFKLGTDTLGVARNTHPDATEGWEVDRPMPTEFSALHRVTYTPEEKKWINDTLTKVIHDGPSDSRFPIILARRDSVPRMLVYTLMPTTWGDTLVYGAEYARDDLSRVLAEVMYGQGLLPKTFAQGHSIRELVQLQVSDKQGNVVFQSEPIREWSLDDSTRMSAGYGSLLIRAQINRAMAGSLIIGGLPTSRLPFLLALLTVAVALSFVAIAQMRRESELSRLRSDFVASISHELRTPLAQMRLYLETLRLGRFKTSGEREWSLNNVERETARLQHLVERVLRFSRTGRPDDEITEQTDTRAEVQSIIEEFAPLAAARGSRVEFRAAAVPLVMLRPGAMRHIVLNLLDNAVKYGPAKQTVVVRLRTVGNAVQLEVADEGPGIAADACESVWRPYERGTTAAHVAGSGIGLSIVRDVARQHGGDAWIAQSAEKGAHFVVSLPVVASVAAGEKTPVSAVHVPVPS